jgi:catechol 2,3-dioxygenase-like lactoylglutathione lyase family enzyme
VPETINHEIQVDRKMSNSPKLHKIPGLLFLLFCINAYADPRQNDSAKPNELPFTISGWTEVVQSVTNLEQHQRFMQEVAGWEVINNGPVDASTLAAWQLDPGVTAEQVLMGNPGTSRGYLRLVRFDGVEQVQIRSGAQPWESGGIFDINVRVLDMEAKFREIQGRNWHAFSDPIHYNFGPFEVKEWITVGPDGLAFALIERVKPELEGWPQMRDISRAFNSTQVVSDMPATLHFYRDVLGFQKYLYWKGVSEEAGASVLGLPLELTTEIEREVWILNPQGLNEGSVELLQFHGLSGRNLAPRAIPPNLGMLMLRFPVDDLDALVKHLYENGVEIQGPVGTTHLMPWAESRQISVRSPDGAWLDFYQKNN